DAVARGAAPAGCCCGARAGDGGRRERGADRVGVRGRRARPGLAGGRCPGVGGPTVTTPWHVQRMAALDFESSDKDADTARIVTCALILVAGGIPTGTRAWLLNPGIPMVPEAIEVHGITD